VAGAIDHVHGQCIDDVDAVLLDDDIFVREEWEASATAKGIKLKTYADPVQFLADAPSFPEDLPIYLDSQIEGWPASGEEIARGLYRAGMSRLYLATGLPSITFGGMSWLSGVQGKEPPEWT